MTGEALTLDQEHGDQAPAHLALFAAVLLCRPLPPDHLVIAVSARAHAQAQRALATGRAPLEHRRTEAYRILYQAHRSRAAATRSTEAVPARGPQWERAVRALYALRHRQRASLALRYLAGFDEPDTARVLGIRELEGRRVLEAAVAASSRLLGGPVDVRRALRKAGGRLSVRPAPEPAPETAPGTGPEPGPSTLVAIRPPAPRRPHRVVRVLTAPTVPVARLNAGTLRAPDRSNPARRLMLPAAACLILASVLVPVSAHVGERMARPAPAAPAAVAAPEVLAARIALSPDAPSVVLVEPGDSLWAIAAHELGDPGRWTQIWARNQGRTMTRGERFRDPDLIKPGWVLRLQR